MQARSKKRFPRPLLGFALLALGASFLSRPADASNPYLEVPPVQEAQGTPAYLYANFSNEQALQELRRRSVPFEEVTTPVAGVRAPIRLTAPVRGVHIHSTVPEEQRASSPYEILDARLALALDDLCSILELHGIVELVHFTMYRPPPGGRTAPASRHPGGLAIDFGAIRKSDGSWLSVGPHWEGRIGAKTCGKGSRRLAPRRSRELRSILCEAHDRHIFHYLLSPHFDEAHGDHLHLEIKPGVRWFLAN